MSEPERTDRLRLGRSAPTGSARREKQAQQPPDDRGRGRVGGTRLGVVDTAGGSTSQTGQSHTMDSTQYQYVEAPEQHHVEPPQQQHPEQQHAESDMENEDEGFPEGLMSCHFYRTSVNTWHASFGTIKE